MNKSHKDISAKKAVLLASLVAFQSRNNKPDQQSYYPYCKHWLSWLDSRLSLWDNHEKVYHKHANVHSRLPVASKLEAAVLWKAYFVLQQHGKLMDKVSKSANYWERTEEEEATLQKGDHGVPQSRCFSKAETTKPKLWPSLCLENQGQKHAISAFTMIIIILLCPNWFFSAKQIDRIVHLQKPLRQRRLWSWSTLAFSIDFR